SGISAVVFVPSAARPTMLSFVFEGPPDHRDLHSFPTRRSSDLGGTRRPPSAGSGGRSGGPRHGAGSARPAPSAPGHAGERQVGPDRKSTRLNSSHVKISYAVFCLKKKKQTKIRTQPRTPKRTRA